MQYYTCNDYARYGSSYNVDFSDRLYDNGIAEKCTDIIDYFINEKGTLRLCEKETLIPKSTIHLYINTYIKIYRFQDYMIIRRILDYNKQNRCKSRRFWTGKP